MSCYARFRFPCDAVVLRAEFRPSPNRPTRVSCAAVTIALAILALVVSGAAAFFAWQQASATRRSADVAESSLRAADRAADAAKDSAETATVLALVERHRLHAEYRPDFSGGHFEILLNPRTDLYAVFYVFTPPLSYRVRATAVHASGGRSTLSIDPNLLVPAGHEARVFVREMKGLSVEDIATLPQRLEFRFWPPQEVDNGEKWTCPCGADVTDGSGDGAGHWEHVVKVDVPPGSQLVRRAAAGGGQELWREEGAGT